MKRNILYIAMACMMVFVSCKKEKEQQSQEGREVEFGAKVDESDGSKTYLNGTSVLWADGDQISVNGSAIDLAEGAGYRYGTFRGKVTPYSTDKFYVGYPASATTFNTSTGEMTVSLPTEQNYSTDKPLSGVMPMAAYVEGTGNKMTLHFHNAANLLKINLTGTEGNQSKVTRIEITSTTALTGKVPVLPNGTDGVTFDYVNMTDLGYTITLDCGAGVQLTNTATPFYVIIPKIASSATLNVKIYCANGAYQENTLTYAFNSVNQIYSTEAQEVAPVEDDWINFNDEAMGVTGLPIWSKKNLGATNGSTAQSWYGDYYAWGATTTWYEDGTASSPTWKSGYSGGYIVANTPYYSGSAYTKYYSGDDKMILDEADDAAQQVLGDSWRMPTNDNWKNLVLNTYFEWVYGYKGITGLNGFVVYKVKDEADKGLMTLCYDGTWFTINQKDEEVDLKGEYGPTDPHIFLPAAGRFNETSLKNSAEGYYWSRSRSSDPNFAKAMYFMSYNVDPCDETDYTRNCGISVRPVQ